MDNTVRCGNGYNKTTDEIVKAATKHREAALALKEVSEKQTIRISEYKDKIDKLESAKYEHGKYTLEVLSNYDSLESEITLLKKNLKLKTNGHNHSQDALEEENGKLKARVKQLIEKMKEVGKK